LISNFRRVLYVFFWVISQRLNFICRRFGTLCLFHLYRRVCVEFYTYLPMKMEQTQCSKTSTYEIQTPGNYPEENIQNNSLSVRSSREIDNFQSVLPIPALMHIISDSFKKILTDFMLFIGDQQSQSLSGRLCYLCYVCYFGLIHFFLGACVICVICIICVISVSFISFWALVLFVLFVLFRSHSSLSGRLCYLCYFGLIHLFTFIGL
jgi:hypothetical protein